MAHIERDPVTGDIHEYATPREARQGYRDFPVLYVLIMGLVLASIAWMIVSVF